MYGVRNPPTSFSVPGAVLIETESLIVLYILAIGTLFCLIRKAVSNSANFVWQISQLPNTESDQKFYHFSAARLIPPHFKKKKKIKLPIVIS